MSPTPGESIATADPASRALAKVREGWGHLQLQRPLAAWASWQCALRIVADFPAAREALEFLEQAGELPAAARVAYRFRGPRDPAARSRWDARLRGRNLEDLDDAATAFAALALDDEADAAAWYNRALCLAWIGRNAEAIACLDRVVLLESGSDPESAVAAWTIGEVLRQGAGAETLADDLRYCGTLECNEGEAGSLLRLVPHLRQMPVPAAPLDPGKAPHAIAYEWHDRAFPPASPTLAASDLPRVLAAVVATPGMLRFSSPVPETLADVEDHLASAIGDVSRRVEREAIPLPLFLLDADVWTVRTPPGLDPDVEARLLREAVEDAYENRWIHRPRRGLAGLSPLEASRAAREGDTTARARLLAVIGIREELANRPRSTALYQGYPFDRLRSRLGLGSETDAAGLPVDLACAGESELDRLDPTTLDPHSLREAFESAAGLRSDARTARFAAEIAGRAPLAGPAGDPPELFAVLVREALRADRPSQAFDWLERANTRHPGPPRRIYDTWRAQIHSRTGDPDSALALYEALFRDPDATPSEILEAAEDLLSHGHEGQALPLLHAAADRALERGDEATRARAEALAGGDEATGP